MRPVNLEAVGEVAGALNQLGVDFALTGGVVVSFLLDYPDVVIIRPTNDVDAIAAVVNLVQYSKLEQKLRDAGFQHDTSDNAPPCRFIYRGISVDVMPSRDVTGRFSDRWFRYALQTASVKTLRGVTVKTVSASCFVATKLTAFEDRGKGDYFSHDLEDIITVIDGRFSLVDEIAREELSLRNYIRETMRGLMCDQRFLDALPGHLGGDETHQKRLPKLIRRLEAIAGE